MIEKGHNPIVFCRFIPTAEYVARHLRDALGSRVEVMAVTGTLAAAEREERVAQLAVHERRVLVATDCLSEGINLQEHFDAVMHYDLSWNPTRHEQREGRVDRYGQPEPTVRVVTFYGENSPIDGLVLEVLLRKHQRIRKSLGVAVPVPTDSAAVIDAILEGLITRGREGEAAFEQLSLDVGDIAKPLSDELELEWQSAAEREKRTQTMFAQYAIKPEEVHRELLATQDATGAGVDVRRFVTGALNAYGATVREGSRGGLVANLERRCARSRRLARPFAACARSSFAAPVQCALDSHERPMHCHHEKLVIVDGEIAFVGGIDLTSLGGDRFDTTDHPMRGRLGWHDASSLVRGPAVADVAAHFAARWREVTGEQVDQTPSPVAAGDIELQVVRTVPDKVHDFLPQCDFRILEAYTYENGDRQR